MRGRYNDDGFDWPSFDLGEKSGEELEGRNVRAVIE